MESNTIQEPLVSIIVVTYNSSQYVIETLESAKQQSYKNIELIITDDCSADNTVELCIDWMKINDNRFKKVDLIESTINTGISANCNRGVKATTGEWCKLIAGDDLLATNCIEKFISYIIQSENNINIICSNQYIFRNDNREDKRVTNFQTTAYFSDAINASGQFKIALRISGTVPAPTILFRKKIYDELGGYTEKYKYLEDYLFFLKANNIGEKIFFLIDALVYYRIHRKNISKNLRAIINLPYKNFLEIRFDYCYQYLPFIERLDVLYSYFVIRKILQIQNISSRLSTICRILYKGQYYCNPFFLYRNFLKLCGKEYRYINCLKNSI